jgi:hypothetical protein
VPARLPGRLCADAVEGFELAIHEAVVGKPRERAVTDEDNAGTLLRGRRALVMSLRMVSRAGEPIRRPAAVIDPAARPGWRRSR